ncbi:MAG: recombinase RecA [Thermoplasmata archaeon]|nr:MAG: recombinase RecA [Thermoplasmata archaeon]
MAKATTEQKNLAEKALQLVLNQINGVKGNKKPDVIKIGKLGEMKALNVPVIPSGSMALDMALGVGGYPQGRIIEIFGSESSGKTTLCLHAIAEAQRLGFSCAFIDVEHTLDVGYARALGVDVDKLLFSQPDDGDEAMRIVDSLARSGLVKLIVVDSVASLVTAAEMEGEITDNHIGRQARLMSQALKKLTVVCGKTGATILFTNQIRMKIGVLYGSPEVTSGGNALKFYASCRLDVRRKEPIKEGTNVVGAVTRVRVVKNKVAPPFKQAFFNIMYGVGIDKEADMIAVAVDEGVIKRAGAWYSYHGEQVGQGLSNTIEYFKSNPSLIEGLREELLSGPGENNAEQQEE